MADQKKSPLTGLTLQQEALIVGGVALYLGLILVNAGIYFEIDILPWLDVLLGALLSLFIITIYVQQFHQLREQTEIENRMLDANALQTRVIKQGTNPLPIVTDFWFSNTGGEDPRPYSTKDVDDIAPPTERDECLLLQISNETDAPAKNLRVVCVTDVAPVDREASSQVDERKEGINNLNSTRNFYGSQPTDHGGVLPAGAQDMGFSTTVGVGLPNTDGDEPLCRTIREVVGKYDHILRIGFVVLYDNQLGETDHIFLNPGFEIQPEDCSTAQNIDLEYIGRCGQKRDIEAILQRTDWDPPSEQRWDLPDTELNSNTA